MKSAYPIGETIERLKKDIAGKGIKFFSEIDQAKLAADAGIKLYYRPGCKRCRGASSSCRPPGTHAKGRELVEVVEAVCGRIVDGRGARDERPHVAAWTRSASGIRAAAPAR